MLYLVEIVKRTFVIVDAVSIESAETSVENMYQGDDCAAELGPAVIQVVHQIEVDIDGYGS
jgi:hypothetical protein